MASGRGPSVEELLALARDRSKKSRSALVSAVNELYSGEEKSLSASDREIMFDILRVLLHEVEASVRRRLAERFAEQSDVPGDLLVALANDTIDIAFPVLTRSELLRDEELIEIIQQHAMEHQTAIAMRPELSERVTDALVETENEDVIRTAISNDGARFHPATMARLIEQARLVVSYQQPLAYRRDLSPRLARKLVHCVSAALRQYVVTNFHIDPTEFDDIAETAMAPTRELRIPLDAEDEPGSEPPEDISLKGMMVLLDQDRIHEFLDRLQAATLLRPILVRRFLFEPGGHGLAVACKAIGLKKHSFGKILVRFRQGRLGEDPVGREELKSALDFFGGLNAEAAMTVLRRWRRDEEYLDALRIVEEAG